MVKRISALKNQVQSSVLFRGSAFLFISSILGNIFNYLYHLTMGRLLGPVDYGLLASLISLSYLLGVPLGTMNKVVVKYASALGEKKNDGLVRGLYFWFLKNITLLSGGFFLILLAVSPLLSNWLKIDSLNLIIVVLTANFIGIFSAFNISILNGLLDFSRSAALGAILSLLKLLLGVFLVLLGFRVLGAVTSFLLTGLVGGVVSFWLVRRWLVKKEISPWSPDLKGIIDYTLPSFIFSLSFTSLYSSDVILARRFLTPREAGFYAALSTLGKVIFFASGPVIAVMFPLVSKNHSGGKNYKAVFRLSCLFTALISLGGAFFYFLFPKLVVTVLFGRGYLAVMPYLNLFALIFVLFTFNYLLMNFYLSIKKTRAVWFYLAAALLQVGLIFIYHQSIAQIAFAFLGSLTFLFLLLLGYYWKNEI